MTPINPQLSKPVIGIFGGTFDPIHLGHVHCALQVLQQCPLEHIRLMPCHLPPHRASPGVSPQQRAAMVQLAITNHQDLKLETLELEQHRPSYTAISLQQLQQRYPQHKLAFIMGMDAFNQFTSWHRWQEILQCADVIVCQRPEHSQLSSASQALLTQHEITAAQRLQQPKTGQILLLDNPLQDISATTLRQQLAQSQTQPDGLDTAVWNYIQQHQLYRDDDEIAPA
jgi:nicotinate-nucleotide adenylyltransferase